MRRFMVVAATLAALAMAPRPGEAGDRDFGFRHFSSHPSAGLHLPHGFKHHHGQFFGKHRHFKSRHFGHFGHGGIVLKFSDGNFFLSFGSVPHFKRHHFGHGHGRPRVFFGFGHPRHVATWHQRGFAFDRSQGFPKHPRDFRQSVPRSGLKSGQGAYSAATREALLTQLEQLGFRDVPELLRRHGH